ncbi:MAG TPA: YggS family pyridoxal phosphate-dependent enzyme [Candidatus Izemoplasmatales bacterium]|nr:YggS family pyridoxal phosphate-dependent enzyme [Candidatus Izemoplasmatales bacterium]
MLNVKQLNIIKEKMDDQTLIAVTKYVDEDAIRALANQGVFNVGENRVKVFLEKYNSIDDTRIIWHFIGHLQSKKVKKMIQDIDYLHSLDRMSLVKEVQKHREKPLSCFIEVNISGEDSKYGLSEEKVFDFYHKVKEYDKINVIGLMGMAKHTDDNNLIRKNFQILCDLKEQIEDSDDIKLKLSMGMSNDYQIAIDMGASYLRIGSLLFKEED